MQLNNIPISDRHNRPVVLSKVGLQAHFISDGQYTDPYQISAVTIFSRDVNLYPSSVLNADTQLIDSSAMEDYVLMNFANSASLTTDSSFNTSNYTGGATNSSGIFKIGTGKYIVVLDGTINLSGVYNLDGSSNVIANRASATGDYIDVWTIKWVEGSLLQTVFNEFTLRKGGFTVLTQPLMVKVQNRMINNRFTLDSKENLKIASEVYVENRDIDSSIKNLLRDNVVTSASVEIIKRNDSENLPAWVTVSSFSDTSALTTVTADNVILLQWDTAQLRTHPQLLLGNFGSIQGVYAIRVKFSVFGDTIISNPMYVNLT